MTDEIRLEVSGPVATITLNRPSVLNAYTEAMVEQWLEYLDRCRNDPDVRVIVITGTGKGFCTGGDVGGFDERSAQTPSEVKMRLVQGPQRLPRTIHEIDKPVIAAINGVATGGGLDIALACDIRVAAASARLAETYTRMGLLACMGGAYFLPRMVGSSKALQMLWTSEWVSAQEAFELGIVSGVHPDEELAARVAELASTISEAAPLSVQMTKRVMRMGMTQDLSSSLEYAASNLPFVRLSADHREAVAAYKEKRPPQYSGK